MGPLCALLEWDYSAFYQNRTTLRTLKKWDHSVRTPTQNGTMHLPDVSVTDKNDTFHLMGASFSSFRLMARAVKRDLFGNLSVVESILPAVTGKFIVSVLVAWAC